MSVRLTWLPNTEPNMDYYEWQRATDINDEPGSWEALINVSHVIPGPNYDATTERFFYDDTTGDNTNWYRMRALVTSGNTSGWCTPFRASSAISPPTFPNTVTLDEDYGATNALQPTDEDGVPLDEVQIRIWKKIDFDLQNFEAVVGVTETDETGSWTQPVVVEAGFTYVIQFYKPGSFGPNSTEVIVP